MKNFKEVRESYLIEGLSRRFNDRDVDKEFKNMKDAGAFYGDLDKAREEMKKDYHPGNSARPKVWTALRYPVRDGDYYFAFIDKNQKKNMKYNEKLNDALKAAKVGGDKKSEDDLWLVASNELRTYPKSLGWNDTMTREEVYGAIQHMLGKIREDVSEVSAIMTPAGIKKGKRKMAPKFLRNSVEESINELNGQTGPVLNIGYRPQRQGGKLGSHSTITKSDLYEDATNNKKNWSITANTNSLAFRLPHPKGHEKDRKDWMDLLDSAKGDTSNMIRGGGFTKSEVQELKRDYEKAIKAFGGTKVVSQIHEIYVRHNKPGGLKVKAGLLAMLKALDEFGMRNHVSVSSRDGVLTRIQDAGQYNESVEETETVKEFNDPTKNFPRDREWKKLVRKHKRHIKALQDRGKDLPSDAEEDFVSWGMDNGEIKNSDDIERFIDDELLNASFVPVGGMNLKELRRKNAIISEKYRSKFKSKDIAKAVEIAHSMGGNMTGAYKKIEQIKKGLGDDPMVSAALRVANESTDVNEVLGAIKKAVAKVTGKKSPEPKNDGSDDPGQQLMDKIDKLEAKLKKTREKLKKAQGPEGDDDSEDYWSGIEMNQTQELEKLKAKLKDME